MALRGKAKQAPALPEPVDCQGFIGIQKFQQIFTTSQLFIRSKEKPVTSTVAQPEKNIQSEEAFIGIIQRLLFTPGHCAQQIKKPLDPQSCVSSFAIGIWEIPVLDPLQIFWCKFLQVSDCVSCTSQPAFKMLVRSIKASFLSLPRAILWAKHLHRTTQHARNACTKISGTTVRHHVHQIPLQKARVLSTRHQKQRWHWASLPWDRLKNRFSPGSMNTKILEWNIITGVGMAPRAYIHPKMGSERMGNLHLERMVTSKAQKDQMKSTACSFDASKVWSGSRSATFSHEPVNHRISSSSSKVVLGVVLVWASGNQKQPMYGTQSNSKEGAPQKLHDWLAAEASPFITMQKARQTMLQAVTITIEDIVKRLYLQHLCKIIWGWTKAPSLPRILSQQKTKNKRIS